MEGILPVYKPVGMTSYDVIRIFKKNNPPPEGEKRWKVGHGGTLDPFAEGVLLILLGRAGTKQFDSLRKLHKTYLATATVGAYSDTLDCTGEISLQVGASSFQQLDLQKQIPKFVGEIEQKVPEYSAAKVDGRPRYKYAREGIVVTPTSKKVLVTDLQIKNWDGTTITFETTVSSGTYIRQLSYDLLKSVGVESYLSKLVRTKIGEIGIEDCATIEELNSAGWQDKVR